MNGRFWRKIERFAQNRAKAADANERIRPKRKRSGTFGALLAHRRALTAQAIQPRYKQTPAEKRRGLMYYFLILAIAAVVVILGTIFLHAMNY